MINKREALLNEIMKDTPIRKTKFRDIYPKEIILEKVVERSSFCLNCLSAKEIELLWNENRRRIDERSLSENKQ
jgi:hypothetical protein